jgi:hypothetical protein
LPPPNTTIFTAADIEKMRLFVTEHDKKASVNEFDLNNPPRTNYVHQHFPKLVYNLDADGKSINQAVADEHEEKAALAAGWANEPVAPAEPEEMEIDPALAAEVAEIDKKLAEARNKKKKK